MSTYIFTLIDKHTRILTFPIRMLAFDCLTKIAKEAAVSITHLYLSTIHFIFLRIETDILKFYCA